MCESTEKFTESKAANNRLKLWELESGLLCSVIGTCLNVEELRKIGNKMSVPIKGLSDFEIHELFVKESCECSDCSRSVNKTLNRKFELSIKLASRCRTSEELMKFWRVSRAQNRLAGAYWAILTHSAASASLVREVFGEVHMLSHLAGVSIRKDEQKIAELTKKLEVAQQTLRSAYDDFRRRMDERNKELAALKGYKEEAERQSARLSAALNRITELDAETGVTQLNAAIQKLEEELAVKAKAKEMLEHECHGLRLRNKDINASYLLLQEQFEDMKREVLVLEQIVMNQDKGSECGKCGVCEGKQCPCPDLCGRCVLYVGGQHSLVPHYRQIVEQLGGEFIHHDGGKEEHRVLLENKLKKSDGVVCPINCISHDACLRVKRLCKQWQKPFVPVRTSSLSALARGIEHIVAVIEN